MQPADALLPLVLFTALMLAVSLHGLTASGHFPPEHRSPRLSSCAGRVILLGTSTVAVLSLAVAVASAWYTIPWYAAIIAGGAAVLAAPLLLRSCSDNFVDGRGAMIVFAGAAAVLAGLLIRVTLGGPS